MQVSVQTMIRNEIDFLPRYWSWIRRWAGEWVVLDGESTDGSVEYLNKISKVNTDITVKVYSDEKYDLKVCKDFNFLLQESMDKCTYGWVWLGYIDEFAPLLEYAIAKLILEPKNVIFRRYNIWSLYPSYFRNVEKFIRLYPRFGSEWKGDPIHSEKLSNNYPNFIIDNVPIYHLGEARNIDKIIDKEKRFEACGKSTLTSNFTDNKRKLFDKNDIDLLSISDMFKVNNYKPVFSPYKILDNWSFNDYALLDMPVSLSVFLTEICNYKCDYCLFNHKDYKSNLIHPEAMYNLLSECKGKVKSIEYCGGGEPTLHPRFDEIVNRANILGYEQGLITNGSTLHEKNKLLARFMKYVRVSLDAVTTQGFIDMHGVDEFYNVLMGIRELITERNRVFSTMQIGVKFTIGQKNKDQIKEMYQFAKDLGVDNVQFRPLRYCEDELVGEETISSAQYQLDTLKRFDPDFIYGNLQFKVPTTPKCLASKKVGFIDANGDVYICCYFKDREEKHKLGNIYESNFKTVWFNIENFKKRNCIDMNECSKFDCRFFNYNKVLYENMKDPVVFL